jgi:hypothetical protein
MFKVREQLYQLDSFLFGYPLNDTLKLAKWQFKTEYHPFFQKSIYIGTLTYTFFLTLSWLQQTNLFRLLKEDSDTNSLNKISKYKDNTGMHKAKASKGLPGNVYSLGLVSFLNDLSSEVTIRTLPLFLANVLGVKTSIIGLIEGVAESTSTLLRIFSGWLSDRINKRKPLVVIGYGLSSLDPLWLLSP